jgi:hypothetical protein
MLSAARSCLNNPGFFPIKKTSNMIRIDEIYNNTFWPWIQQNIPLTRMFFCDPPGDSRPEALHNFGEDRAEHNYIWFHDQEPIHLDVHKNLFDDVVRRNRDLQCDLGPRYAILVTSEKDSADLVTCCDIYGWRSFYYFYHGWAALDWYRGYHRTYLMPEPNDRRIIHSFISANRIIGGRRQHRVMLLHYLQQHKIRNALISFPATCPVENIAAVDIAAKLGPEVRRSMSEAGLPWNFPGEVDHPMHSCWLSLFEENAGCLAQVVTETVYYGQRHHLTEKIFKPICLRMPFVLVSTAGSLEYLKSYGFKTFDTVWDESYDQEIDDDQRLRKIAVLLKSLDEMSPQELQHVYTACVPIIEHNYRHFYNGAFEQVLWQELQQMLEGIKLHVTQN